MAGQLRSSRVLAVSTLFACGLALPMPARAQAVIVRPPPTVVAPPPVVVPPMTPGPGLGTSPLVVPQAPVIVAPPKPQLREPPPDASACCPCKGRNECSETCCFK